MFRYGRARMKLWKRYYSVFAARDGLQRYRVWAMSGRLSFRLIELFSRKGDEMPSIESLRREFEKTPRDLMERLQRDCRERRLPKATLPIPLKITPFYIFRSAKIAFTLSKRGLVREGYPTYGDTPPPL